MYKFGQSPRDQQVRTAPLGKVQPCYAWPSTVKRVRRQSLRVGATDVPGLIHVHRKYEDEV